MGKVILQKKVGKVSKFQERLFNENFKAGNGEERKGKGKLSVPPVTYCCKVSLSAISVFLVCVYKFVRAWTSL